MLQYCDINNVFLKLRDSLVGVTDIDFIFYSKYKNINPLYKYLTFHHKFSCPFLNNIGYREYNN